MKVSLFSYCVVNQLCIMYKRHSVIISHQYITVTDCSNCGSNILSFIYLRCFGRSQIYLFKEVSTSGFLRMKGFLLGKTNSPRSLELLSILLMIFFKFHSFRCLSPLLCMCRANTLEHRPMHNRIANNTTKSQNDLFI